MKIIVLFSIVASIAAASTDDGNISMLKFKDGFDTVYSYTHSRKAHTPDRNITESCTTKVYLRPSNVSNELFVLFKDAIHHYQIITFREDEDRQLDEPFKIRLQGNGEIDAIYTKANESIKSLTIKNQALKVLLPNHYINYREIVKSTSNFTTPLDLSYLPFGTCNATVNSNSTADFKYVKIEAYPEDCTLLNLRGGKLLTENPEDSRFLSKSFFDKDEFTLTKRYQDTNVTMASPDGKHKGVVGYHFQTEFLEFKEKEAWDLSDVTEEHNLEELQELQLY